MKKFCCQTYPQLWAVKGPNSHECRIINLKQTNVGNPTFKNVRILNLWQTLLTRIKRNIYGFLLKWF